MIAKTTDKFPPEQVKEGIGLLRIAMAKTTDPANKMSLCDARIRTLLGIMKHKCADWMEPSMPTLLSKTLEMMVADMRRENSIEEVEKTLAGLEHHLSEMAKRSVEEKLKYLPRESIILLRDYNIVLECRNRWKEASDIYMTNHQAWATSNKIVADIADQLEDLELEYGLIVMPKSYSYDINELSMFNKRPGSDD